MWYFYRPRIWMCEISDDDVVRSEANVTLSDISTTGKFPEYHQVWKDNILRVVAIFGKAKEDKDSPTDGGVKAYQQFYGLATRLLNEKAGSQLHITPEIMIEPTKEQNEVVVRGTLPDGKQVEINLFLVTNIRNTSFEFNERYHALSQTADLIVYNGHAGLGANIRSLSRKGHWIEGQYTLFFMNGCDTYAYVDDALFSAHAAVNPDDPIGTKYVDMINNALPSFFYSMPQATFALVEALVNFDQPASFETIFAKIDPAQLVLVTGEEDNEFVPGPSSNLGFPQPWDGIELSGTLDLAEAVHFETPLLEPGTYRFVMNGTKDADLYIRIGLIPTQEEFDCRPYKLGSDEVCSIDVTQPVRLFGMVRGWRKGSQYTLFGDMLKEEE